MQLFQSAFPTFLSIKQLLVYHLSVVRTAMMHFSLPSNYLNMFVCVSSGPFCRSFAFSKPLGPPAGRINVAPLSCIIMTCINPIHHSTASPSAFFSLDKQKCCDAIHLPTACVSSACTKEFVGVKEVLSEQSKGSVLNPEISAVLQAVTESSVLKKPHRLLQMF